MGRRMAPDCVRDPGPVARHGAWCRGSARHRRRRPLPPPLHPLQAQVTEVDRIYTAPDGQRYVVLRKRAFVPTQAQLGSLTPLLKPGKNMIKFRYGRQELHGQSGRVWCRRLWGRRYRPRAFGSGCRVGAGLRP